MIDSNAKLRSIQMPFCTRLEKQRDDALLEVTREKEAIAALRGETDALQRQNQSLMAALAGNKQTGGQNA